MRKISSFIANFPNSKGPGPSPKVLKKNTAGPGVFVIGCGHLSHVVKMHYFFKNHLLYSQA